MAAQHKARGVQPGLPAFLRPDRRCVVEQPVFFLLLAQPGDLGVDGMIGCEQCLLAMKDRWIGAGAVVEALDLASAERELDAPLKCRVRVGLEIGIFQLDQYFWTNSLRSARVSRLSTTGSLHRSYRDVGTRMPNCVFAPARIGDHGGFLSPAIDCRS
jgi:hypothetical protein